MSLTTSLARVFDIRPDEMRRVALSVIGAFLIIGFSVLERSLREALFLGWFPVESLPYITAAVAVLSLPAVGLFTVLLGRFPPSRVLKGLVMVLGAGLLALWPVLMAGKAAIVALYLWSSLATLLLTSGFWVVTADHFPLRGAKRLYGIIAGGGTAGALIMGVSLEQLTQWLGLPLLLPVLAAVLGLFLATQLLMPPPPAGSWKPTAPGTKQRLPAAESISLVWGNRHLRLIAGIVVLATMASTLVDYQFKELARINIASTEELTGFFGAFYGWAGGAALLFQLLLVNRLLSSAGIAWSLALLPLCLALGSLAFLAVPALALIVGLRGADYSLRKALHRPALEVAYLPVHPDLRRRTKTFIDSVLDSGAEGLGAAVIFFLVTMGHLPSRYLSLVAAVLAAAFVALSLRMGRRYQTTIAERLGEEGGSIDLMAVPDATQDYLYTGSFTQTDLTGILSGDLDTSEPPPRQPAEPGQPATLTQRLASRDDAEVRAALGEVQSWGEAELQGATRLLARDSILADAARALIRAGEPAAEYLGTVLKDSGADFVIRRRIPAVLSRIGGPSADDALIDVLEARRFEIRYRAAVALCKRRERGLPCSSRDWRGLVWRAVDFETGRETPVWELQRLLDPDDPRENGLIKERTGVRGELSLEHTFRMLTLVLDPKPVKAAFQGILLDDHNLKSFTLEYLEHVLPDDVRRRLWEFIGDVSEHKREKARRPIDAVVQDLMSSRATVFGGQEDLEALQKLLKRREGEEGGPRG